MLVMLLLGQGPMPGVATDASGDLVFEPDVSSGGLPSQVLPAGSRVAVVPVEGMIYDFAAQSMKRRVERAIDAGADVIVIRLDTNGGYVPDGLEMARYLRALKVPTVAWVDPKAYSAGAFIATACDEIVVAPGGVMGDAAPIDLLDSNMGDTERAKALAPILAELAANARANGYSPAALQAMAILGVELYLVENPVTQQRELVNRVDYELMVNGRDVSGRFADTGLPAPPMPEEELPPGVTVAPGGAASPNEDRVGGIAYQLATDADAKQWQPVTQLPGGVILPGGLFHDGKTLLTLTQDRLIDAGLATATVATAAELQAHLRAGSIIAVPPTWPERAAEVLSSLWVRAVLVIVLLVGLYFAFQAPGFGVGETIALLAAVALFGAPMLIGIAEIWHVLLFLLGFALLILELLFAPSFGIIGILGIVMMFFGLVLAVVPVGNGPGVGPFQLPPQQMWHHLMAASVWTLLGLIGGIAGFIMLARYHGEVPGLNRLVLKNEPHDGAGVAPIGPISGDDVLGGGTVKRGDEGRVSSGGLHPGGRIQLGELLVDVVSTGRYVEPGTPVRVVEVHGNRIVVEPITA